MIRRAILQTSSSLKRSVADLNSFFKPPAPQLALASACPGAAIESASLDNNKLSPSLIDCLWLAVPKRKVTPGKKRMKTTNQNRIKRKNHIIVDRRTGETTLRHRLPFNWKDYVTGN